MRTYYDHELGYRRIAERGGTGWDDCPSLPTTGPQGSYDALEGFLTGPHAPATATVLDLGCGGGQAAFRLARRGYRVTGIDFAPTAIELARTNAQRFATEPGAHDVPAFVVGDCLALPFPDAAFDLAIDNHVLHCLLGDDRARLLRETARVLRPGGMLFSDTMSREGDFDPAVLHCDPATFVSTRGNRYWTFGPELDELLASCGFDVIARARRSSEPGVGDSLIRVCRSSGAAECAA